MVGDTFERTDQIVVVPTESARARKQRDVMLRRKGLHRRDHPLRHRSLIDRLVRAMRTPAPWRILSSQRMTRAPVPAAARAAESPVTPPPITRTSQCAYWCS